MNLYEIQNLKYLNILNIKALNISKGEISIIYGPSGSGKTTLVNILKGQHYNYDGDVKFNGELMKNKNILNFKHEIGVLCQNSLLLGKTVKEEFDIVSKLLNINICNEEINKMLQIVDLDVDLNLSTQNMSGGQKQRLYLARTLSTNKVVYILDEPTSALDAKTVKKVMNNLHDYVQETKKTIILISHDLNIINDLKFNKIDMEQINDN